ncbi:PREDICTED: uncharacterized protein LOC109165041 isoform X2 [Ipomoea nil]|uniref:uncharacterized protein LOC109165041 isoform X2 n=1 Tax=Ipomoea nil TaxID=35883 RepID=UPI000901FDAA|nr:PREDICTED: uncharacterized protein LOC109165041 isoform X2 [Ipomoea nil]
MERNEPKLAPEWLRSVGNKSACSSASSLQLGVSEASKFTRGKSSSVNGTGYDVGRPVSADHAAISHLQRSSNRSSSVNQRSYSNFGRNRHYSRDRYKDKYENSVQPPDTSRKNSGSRTQKDGFRPSQLMISERHGEKLMRNSCNGENNSTSYLNGLPDKYGLSNTLHRSESERGFLLNGAEGRQTATGIGRVRSPGLSVATPSTTRSLPDVKNGDKWTSHLAEVPPTTRSDGSGCSSVQLATPFAAPTLSTAAGAGFNMAEAVAKSPRSVQTTSQLSNGNQRLEDLAIKQSRILIPVTPSAPKISALNPSDKIKSKVTEQRQQHHPLSPSHVASNSVRSGGLGTTDALKKSSFGKLHVLKPSREKSSVSSVVSNCLDPNPDTKGSKPMLSPVSTMQRPPYNPVSPTAEPKPSRAVTEKRLSSQAQSRNDFFNLMRKKSMGDAGAASDTAAPEVSTEPTTQAQDAPSFDNPSVIMAVDNTNEDTGKGDAIDGQKQLKNGKTHPSPDAISEEEAAFLRSLGWEENADEGGLTEEEISTFYRDLTKVTITFAVPLNAYGNGNLISDG